MRFVKFVSVFQIIQTFEDKHSTKFHGNCQCLSHLARNYRKTDKIRVQQLSKDLSDEESKESGSTTIRRVNQPENKSEDRTFPTWRDHGGDGERDDVEGGWIEEGKGSKKRRGTDNFRRGACVSSAYAPAKALRLATAGTEEAVFNETYEPACFFSLFPERSATTTPSSQRVVWLSQRLQLAERRENRSRQFAQEEGKREREREKRLTAPRRRLSSVS